MSFGKWLKTTREAAGFTQEQLAEQITLKGHKVTGANISIIEREYDKDKDQNPTRPHKKFVIYAAATLNENVDQVLMLADYAPTNQNILPEEFQEFDFSKFSKELLNDIAEYIRFKLSRNLIKFNENLDQNESTMYKTEVPLVGEIKDRKKPGVDKAKETNGK